MAEQKYAFKDEDIQIIKGLFKDNDEMVAAVRGHYLQFPLTNSQKACLAMLQPAHKEFFGRLFKPLACADNPLGRISDAWGSIDTSKGVDESFGFIMARHKSLKYLDQQTAALYGEAEVLRLDNFVENPGENIPMSNLDRFGIFVGVEARRVVLHLIDAQLLLCKQFAELKEETPEEAEARNKKDSNK